MLRSIVMVPLLRFVLAVCLAKTLMILIEKLFVGAVSLIVQIFKIKPEKKYKWKPIKPDDGMGSSVYPMVLVQIPMYNEKEVVYKLSIGAACRLEWPSDRVIIQVLDDSTDLVLKPEPDFLLRTVPFLIHNPDIALVQSRWRFVNADECLMTRLQEMSLNYHFKIEQQAGSTMFGFFNFNATAGVWRVTAISDAGGWKDRTTVEDMDLAVRASLRGWKFVYVDDVHVKSELPSTFKAFRFQQHRWSCGPANLFKKMFSEIVQNSKVSIWKKLHIICDFFFIGKIASPTVTFIYYCGVIPLSVFFPEVVIPYWGVVYVPTVITLCKSVGTPR
ncbi:cellulose synthase like [Rhynchospora pubera]|uniref:Cellulose synthase like n=1 Tax=Rhynchospora pubera TaxID=906938 RepID=A0AAV8BVL0_9POAL|nr:cellulose synthase like [Rhynchospora pubera]